MKFIPYESRFRAGEILAEFVLSQNPVIKKIISSKIEKVFLFAIPNGGVPVAEGFCNVLNINFNVLRKKVFIKLYNKRII